MFDNLITSLNNLEEAFKGSPNKVLSATESFKKQLKAVKSTDIKNHSNKIDIDDIIKSIEKLSIQSEYKLSILKDFPKYISDKK